MKQSIKILFLVLILQQIICSSSALDENDTELHLNDTQSVSNVTELHSNDTESDSNDSSNETILNDLLFDLKKLCNLTNNFIADTIQLTYNFAADDTPSYQKEINVNETSADQLCLVYNSLNTTSGLQRLRSSRKGRKIKVGATIKIKLGK